MDEGASAAWQERFNDDEISAVQHAMNLKFRDEAAFMAEYQNEPLTLFARDESILSEEEIAEKVNGLRQYAVPLCCDRVTAFIDIQKNLLYYTVAAWAENFTG